MVSQKLITHLETLGFQSWPAEIIREYNGWILRADQGITRRANSVFPREFTGTDVDQAIEYVLEFYDAMALPAMFQMTKASRPEDLDERLAARGFERELQVHVQTAEIKQIPTIETSVQVRIESTLDKDWLACYGQSAGYDNRSLLARKAIMERVRHKKAFALAVVDDEPAGVGFGVVDEEWIGLFSIATRPEYRRRGVATAINRCLVEWGSRHGAERAYLQVEIDNEPALALYERLGFSTLYTYWYRLLR